MERIISRIIKEYDLKVEDVEKNKESTDGNVYIIKAQQKKYVLKVYDDLDHVKSMCKVHTFLASNSINIPVIIPNKKDEQYTIISNHYGILYSFLPGKAIDDIWNQSKDDLIKIIAREMRRFHDLTANNNSFLVPNVPFKVPTELERKSLLHFDLTKSNIFYYPKWEYKIGFIDFDDAKYGPSFVDVAITCALLFITKANGLDKKRMNLFLKEYYHENILEMKKERKYLKEVALNWVNYIMNENEFDTSTNESFEVKKSLIESEINEKGE